jgi:hypothetical protein
MWILYLLGIILAGSLFYTGILAWNAYYHVTKQPRADLYLCDTHGPMPVGATITLFNGDMDQEASDGRTIRRPVRACPICFESKIAKAKEQWNKKK